LAHHAVFISALNVPLQICLGDSVVCVICFVGYSKVAFFKQLRDAAGLCPAECERDPFSQFLHWVLFLVLFTELMMSGEHSLLAICN
jgi:hypothetical protein